MSRGLWREKRFFILAFLILGLSPMRDIGFSFGAKRLYAGEFLVEKLVFAPALFYAGEEVEALVVASGTGGDPESFDLTAKSGLPERGSFANPEIKRVSLKKAGDSWEIRYRFVPWTPGPGKLRGFSAKGSLIPGFDYSVEAAVKPGERDLEGPKPQRDPPGTALYLYGFAGFALLFALGIVAAAGWLLPAARALMARRRAAEAYTALEKSLDYLEGEVESVEPKAFCAVFSHALRLYLSARLIDRAEALTPAELAVLAEDRFPVPGLRDEAVSLLRASDTARFSSEGFALERMRDSVRRAREFGSRAEEALDAFL